MVTIAGYVIDAVPSETHNLDSEATDHPIEDGGDVTDHVRPLPDTLTLEGIVSNTPIGTVATLRENESPFSGEFLPADDAFAFLKEIRRNREPVRIETDVAVYENMALISLTYPRTAKTGDAFQFTATFKQIQIVSTDRTSVPVSVPRAEKKKNLGGKQAETVDKSKQELAAKQIANYMKKLRGEPHNPALGTEHVPSWLKSK